ncbi:hypothetical protein BH10ACT11_BH10ACT11_04930 [soil metagenome]
MTQSRIPRTIVLWAALLAIVPAIVTLLGWVFGLDGLKSLIPGLPEMHVWTALALIALGSAAILHRDSSSKSKAASVLAGIVGLLGLLFIAEYVFGDIGIDRILGSDAGAHPGRPSLHAAIAMLSTGAALAALDFASPRYLPSRVLTVATLIVVMSAAVGYAFGLDYLTGGAAGTAIHTAAGFIALSVALICLRPDRGIFELLDGDRPGSQLARVLLPVSVLGPLALGLIRLEAQKAGLVGFEVGTAALTVAIIAMLVPLIVVLARRLNRLDDERRRLERERRQAEIEADRIKEDFFAMVSHDLRSPMAAIMGYADLLSEEPTLGELGHEAVEVIDRSAKRQLALLDDLLLMVRTEGSQLEISRGPLELNEVASTVVSQLRPAASQAKLKLNLTGSAPRVYADRKRIEQLVDNLLSNSIKFTPPGGSVDVRLDGDPDSASIEITDTGMGVPEDELPQLFDRLYRARAAHGHGIYGSCCCFSSVDRSA